MAQPSFDEIKIFDDTMDDIDIMRIITEYEEEAFYIADIGNVIEKHREWTNKMPKVIPHFGIHITFFIFSFFLIFMRMLFQILAIKANPDPTVIKVLAALDAGFDCASEVNLRVSLQVYNNS